MNKAVISGKRQGGLIEVPDPEPIADWVVVKVHVAPMCTEYKSYINGRPSASLGHEAAGEVVAVAQPGKVAVGDRVVVMPKYPCGQCALCREGEYIHCEHDVDFAAFSGQDEGQATMAQYLLKPDWLLPTIPTGMSYEHASMACCGLGPSFGALARMGVGAFDTVLITGLGPVGLGGVINARYRGARVIGVEGHPWRAAKARELGAETVVAPGEGALEAIRELTGGVGVDMALDCAGSVAAHRLCIDAARRKGQVALVGECGEDTPLQASRDMIRKGLTLIGSWHYNMADWPKIFQVARDCEQLLDRFITHSFALEAVEQAWALQESGECAKVVLKPW